MKILIRVPDDVVDAYEDMASRNGGGKLTLEDFLVSQLERFKAVNIMDRVVVIGSKCRDELENILQGGSLKDDVDLVSKVQALADIQIQDVRVYWTPGQLAELKRYATKNEITVKEAVERNVQQISAQFFWSVG